MKKRFFIYSLLILVFALCIPYTAWSQDSGNRYSRTKSKKETPLLTIKGSIIDADTQEPISKVNIEITGGNYTTSDRAGEFVIGARVGDELVLRYEGFETKYYTIKDNQRIRLEVRSNKVDLEFKESADKLLAAPPQKISANQSTTSFDTFMVKALEEYKENASDGIENVSEALKVTDKGKPGDIQRAKAFKVLGDIYSHWKQYDLAVSNYKLSLKNRSSLEVNVLLAKGYYLNKNYQESISLFRRLQKGRIGFVDMQTIHEGLGDAFVATGEYNQAIDAFKKAVDIAVKENRITDATRLNGKIANAYDIQGGVEKAADFYGAALDLSETEDEEIATRVRVQTADFFNRNALYDKEIEFRQEALNGFISSSDTISNSDVITPQKQNYKIANAYVAQQKLAEAIPFYEKSIEEAAAKKDLVVEKDATRRLSELLSDMGDFDKAFDSYNRYVALLDESYVLKEQEITQAGRFGKEIAEQQNRILSLEKDRELNESRYQLAFQEQELGNARDNRLKFIIGTLALVAILLMITAFFMYRSNKQQHYANNLLALRGLRSQMNPHFIFNALNSVNSFIALSDERTANKYLADFSQLMRAVLENSEEDFIPLSNEVDLLKKYVMLEHFRFKDKFEYTFTVDDNLRLDDFEIPPMLLQPYVENAVWHGLRYKEEKGHLHIHFQQKDKDTAVVTVSDDGVGRKRSKAMKTDNQKKQKSKGMGNIKKRISILNEMYDDRVDVAIKDVFDNGEGTKVILTLKKE